MFDLVIMVDWSAAASPGPAKPSPDRCWLAWSACGFHSEAEYFRTRNGCMKRVYDLVSSHNGSACVGFDFPFGYPAGSGLGGGRAAAKRIAQTLQSDTQDRNNRFDVAAELNREISASPGPFWGCPVASASPHLTVKNRISSMTISMNGAPSKIFSEKRRGKRRYHLSGNSIQPAPLAVRLSQALRNSAT